MKYDENSASEQFIEMFKNFMEAQTQVASLKPTFCGEICFKMRKGVQDFIETISSNYTTHGTEAIIKDKRDGQEYIVEIRPLRKKP